jgi:alpha-tubulin suppressor-like RCC1 family protein
VRLPTRLDNLPGVIDVATGEKHTCALMQDGMINCWGDNSKGQLGMGVVGPVRLNGAAQFREPMRVGRLTDMIALTTSKHSNCARNQNGQISCWGANETGQLGAGTCTPAEPLPLQVSLGD